MTGDIPYGTDDTHTRDHRPQEIAIAPLARAFSSRLVTALRPTPPQDFELTFSNGIAKTAPIAHAFCGCIAVTGTMDKVAPQDRR